MSADKKHIIKCRSVDFCIFCVVSVAPIFRFLLLIEVYIYFHILAFFDCIWGHQQNNNSSGHLQYLTSVASGLQFCL